MLSKLSFKVCVCDLSALLSVGPVDNGFWGEGETLSWTDGHWVTGGQWVNVLLQFLICHCNRMQDYHLKSKDQTQLASPSCFLSKFKSLYHIHMGNEASSSWVFPDSELSQNHCCQHPVPRMLLHTEICLEDLYFVALTYSWPESNENWNYWKFGIGPDT